MKNDQANDFIENQNREFTEFHLRLHRFARPEPVIDDKDWFAIKGGVVSGVAVSVILLTYHFAPAIITAAVQVTA